MKELGAIYSPEKTLFRVWSPGAGSGGDTGENSLEVLLYDKGAEGNPVSVIAMRHEGDGFWTAEINKNIKNKYYVYRVKRDGVIKTAVDPYAKALGVNGLRGMIADLAKTDPFGFRTHPAPPLTRAVDAVIYETHLRDISMHPHSGIKNRGKYAALTERGTVNPENGLSTGLDHIVELGATHVHLLPVFDYKTIDESLENNSYNWGYDPQNYNAPEGSYSSDPCDGRVRIREFKELVQALHKAGLRVIMDVVYNHLFSAADSSFEILAPGKYFRYNDNGPYSNGSGCGNETASENPMMRQFIVDSVCYWAKEYRIDGFRFDLMGLHDIETMNIIRWELDRIDPSIIIYGEGWAAGASPLEEKRRALKTSGSLLNERIALFSDDIRDGIKGSVMDEKAPGFVNLIEGTHNGDDPWTMIEDIKFGICGAVEHPQVDIARVRYSNGFWAKEPSQCINYASSHDDHSLWDRLVLSCPEADDETLCKMNKLSAAIVLTSQGIPFFQAGEELARSKGGVKNSYRSPDEVNNINWDNKKRYIDLYEYYRGLILLRKTFSAFRLGSAEEIRRRIEFITTERGIIAYTINGEDIPGCPYQRFLVIFNGSSAEKEFSLPPGTWTILADDKKAGITPLGSAADKITLPLKSALVLC